MELDINVDGQHLIHEGKIPEAQEFMLQGREEIFETPSDHLKREELLERLLKIQDRTLRPLPLPGINTTPAALPYKAGINLWGIEIVSGDGLFGGYNLINAGAAAVTVLFFDGYDSSGTYLGGEVLTAAGTNGSAITRYPIIPIKLDNALFVGFSGAALDVAKTLGSVYMIRE